MKLKSSQEGFLMVDHRASPGLPEEIARQTGLDPKYCGEGKLLETATLTCSHCKAVVVKNPLRIRERASCQKCGWHYVCDICATQMDDPNYDHLPFEKLIDVEMSMTANKGITKFHGTPQELLKIYNEHKAPPINLKENE